MESKEKGWSHGRVLFIDYHLVKEPTTEKRRKKIVAQEVSDIDGLHGFYVGQARNPRPALRVIHVQQAPWATRFLLRKFQIDPKDDLVGTTFGRWARFEKPKTRGQGTSAKPVLSGKTFRAQRDPWRGISRSAFGLDYLKHYEKEKITETPANQGLKMMELNHFDAQDNPAYGYDVYAQRLSVYVQLSDGEPGLDDLDIKNPYEEEETEHERLKREYGPSEEVRHHERHMPKLESLDNGSTIIIFEHAQSGSVFDTLIGARQEIEQRWRRLTFYLPREDTSDDERLAIECMDFILRDIFKALAFNWEKYISICETHISILEDKIYDNPADESRAPELWTNSSLWLKVERLVNIHTDIVKEMALHLRQVAHESPYESSDDPWLAGSALELEKVSRAFQSGVVQPTASLSDLMYKSVGIRDARHSLQLGLSMYRLSWITFLCLPLTVITGFFGMNVDTFEGNPSIKWFFITAVPVFSVVLCSWYIFKHSLTSGYQNPLRRGVYETLFYDLSEAHPALWTRRGPKEGVVPVGFWSAMRWRIITKWFDPQRTIAVKDQDHAIEELGVWSRLKHFLVKRWLSDMTVMPATAAVTYAASEDLEAATVVKSSGGAVGELLQMATPIGLAGMNPTAANSIRHRLPLTRYRSPSPEKSGRVQQSVDAAERTAGVDVSEVMVEEKSEDELSGDGGLGIR
ncbi:uncharacterized protein EI97DRAFT_452001 [Westerdykella ornata]|uniref:Cora-domain-containing protein n=1 Tax=Westerdykella ornata TaxID=318751 RepID=A0A6A6JFH8_WESOR|nr:uncharacterized protein EI97DRAFT_452001 [Westerdykella ornata]KAF2273939.1 hypothetical protein EI97DRAFT_452001 [Westerdykella ornata]